MIIKELEEQLLALKPSEKVQVSDADLLTSYPTIKAMDLANAWVYAAAHEDEIDLLIEQNEAV